MSKGQSLQDPFLECVAPRARAGVDLSRQRHQIAGHGRIVRPVRRAAAQHGEPDGLQARDLHRRAERATCAWARADDDVRRDAGSGAERRNTTSEVVAVRTSDEGRTRRCCVQPHEPGRQAIPTRRARGIRRARAFRRRQRRRHVDRARRQAQPALSSSAAARPTKSRPALRRARRRPGAGQPPAVARSGTQPRKAPERRVRRPHRPDPRHLRPARAHARRQAAGRARPAQAHGHAPGARLDPPGTPARRRDRPARPGRNPARNSTAACSASASSMLDASAWKKSKRSATSSAARACATRCRWWRWSATPTPASRRCSTR